MSINYRLPKKLDPFVIGLTLGLIIFFISVQVVLSQPVTAQSLEALDLECRTNYHDYCFGEKWQNIVNHYVNEIISQSQSHKSTLNEDQALLCLVNVEENDPEFGTEECAVIDWLDLLNETQEQKINEIFDKDLDTFSPEDWIK